MVRTPSTAGTTLRRYAPSAAAGALLAGCLLVGLMALATPSAAVVAALPLVVFGAYGATDCFSSVAKVQSGVDPDCGCAEYDYVETGRSGRERCVGSACLGAGAVAGLLLVTVAVGAV